MNEAVFISDLHLHPKQPAIRHKFTHFISWALKNTKKLYILGDFLHVWPGDEALDSWSDSIATDLAKLNGAGIEVYFMPGNRDFLIGKRFLGKAKLQLLEDPSVIQLGNQAVVLSHGDIYCTHDKTHQWFRCLTRNSIFHFLFLCLPYVLRKQLVTKIRNYSQHNSKKSIISMQTVEIAMEEDIHRFAAKILIHGHTHQPGLSYHGTGIERWVEYTLSDWGENPSILCYNNSSYCFFNLGEV